MAESLLIVQQCVLKRCVKEQSRSQFVHHFCDGFKALNGCINKYSRSSMSVSWVTKTEKLIGFELGSRCLIDCR